MFAITNIINGPKDIFSIQVAVKLDICILKNNNAEIYIRQYRPNPPTENTICLDENIGKYLLPCV